MAIYHCTTKTVNRSSGRTAIASMAYRAGEKLKDERTGLTHDFTKKDGVVHTEILSNLDIEIKRSELWNLAEKSENRKDARTAREWVIALPDELNPDQRKDLAKAFARSFVDRHNVIADIAIHEPSKGGNDRNHHAHIMLTTRKAELSPDNKLILTNKADIELSNAKRKTLGMERPKKKSNKFGKHGRTLPTLHWIKPATEKKLITAAMPIKATACKPRSTKAPKSLSYADVELRLKSVVSMTTSNNTTINSLSKTIQKSKVF